jgi:Tfp pilus assembly protein PilX
MSQPIKNQPRGVVALVTVMVVMSVILALGLSVSMVGQDSAALSGVHQDGETAFSIADACTEEGTARLKSDQAYTGGTFPLDGGNCVIVVCPDSLCTGFPANRWVVQGTGTYANSLRIINADISLTFNGSGKAKKMTINSWTEAN